MGTFSDALAGAFKISTAATADPQQARVTSAHPIKRQGATSAESQALYQPGPSFIDQCPWVEALAGEDAILLEDNRSVGVVYEITPIGTEGRTEHFLTEIRDSLEAIFQDVFDEYDEAPWVLQSYTFNEPSLDTFVASVEQYVSPHAKHTPFTDGYLALLRAHYAGICKSGGLFIDDEVTKTAWGGCQQRNYLVLYRRLPKKFKNEDQRGALSALNAVNETAEKLFQSLAPTGIRQRRLSGREFHQWMTRWFNAYTSLSGENPIAFSQRVAVDDDGELPYGNEFTESLFYAHPRSDADNRCWHFDATVTRCLSIDGIRKRPLIGQTTGETRHGDAINTMMDQLPPDTVMVSTIVVVPDDTTEHHIESVAKAAIGDSSDAMRTREDCRTAREIIGNRHKLYRARYGFIVSARSVQALNRITNQARAVLLAHGFRAIAVKDDVRALDNYLLHLPMKYDPEQDRQAHWRNAQLTWVQHIINNSCFFGRSRGTGHPGVLQFNRGGEPLVWDPLNKNDRHKNAHMFMLGPTGAGKSVTLSTILTHTLAIHRPRLFVIEAGNSFGLTAEWYRSLGLSVNVMSLKPGSGMVLPAFSDAHRILDTPSEQASLDDDPFGVDDDGDEEDVERDILGEMEIVATLMITGGEEKEEAFLRRADRRVIRDAILLAARRSHEQQETTLTAHVRDAFYELAQNDTLPEATRQRIRDMGDAIGLFCDGFSGEIFNTTGAPWPECDVTVIDLAYFAREGYEAHLAISVISLLNRINNLAERDQNTAREIVVAIDEAHIITTNPLLAPYLTKIVKMWRKLGAWLWLATQNMQDFPGSAKKLLNMIEWWVCLVMPKQEVEEIERFKQLSPEQRDMLLSASKADRKFTEGVVLAHSMNVLFRSVPPSLMLSLAMTEKHEKAERANLMREQNLSEVDAARLMAQQIDSARGIQ